MLLFYISQKRIFLIIATQFTHCSKYLRYQISLFVNCQGNPNYYVIYYAGNEKLNIFVMCYVNINII